MIKKFIFIYIFIFSAHLWSQISPQSKKVTSSFFPDYEELENITPGLKKKKGYTNYSELMIFINDLVDQNPDLVQLQFIGESQKGKKIPLLILNNQNNRPKIKVWMQGGLHGNEPASTEGMLYVLDKIINDNNYTYLLDKIELRIVPMANIDGYLKQSRYAANGLDLNRDQTKLVAKESIVLKQAFSDFNPDVGLDFHEYRPYRKDFAQLSNFGITALYDAMFLNSGNLNVPENLRILTDTLFVENARQELDKYNFNHHSYISTRKVAGEIHFNQGSTNARSSATNFALTNTISTLLEIRGVGIGKTAFKRRVYITSLIAFSYLRSSYNNLELIKNAIKTANLDNKDIVVTSSKSVYKDTIEAIDLDTNKIIDLEVTIRDGLKAKPDIVRKRPNAYLIDADQRFIVDKLKTLGVKVDSLLNAQEFTIETYKVTDYQRASKKYEKVNVQTIKTMLSNKNILFPKGTYKVSMKQRRSNIIAEVLEPESPNSFVSFGILKTEKNKILPIYRLSN